MSAFQVSFVSHVDRTEPKDSLKDTASLSLGKRRKQLRLTSLPYLPNNLFIEIKKEEYIFSSGI
jgi:hypothetical protein